MKMVCPERGKQFDVVQKRGQGVLSHLSLTGKRKGDAGGRGREVRQLTLNERRISGQGRERGLGGAGNG